MSNLQAITFDVGGTLIEPWPSVGHVYAAVAARHGIEGASPAQLNARFFAAWKALDCRAESRADWAAIVEATFEGVATVADPKALFEALYAQFMEPSAWRVFDDVQPTLAALHSRGMRLAIVSNWDERLRPLLARLNLLDHFELAVVSCEVGSRKPELKIFEQATEALGLSPDRVLHVGDSLEQDILGARAAGMQAVGIRRAQPKEDPLWIRSLSQLLGPR
jgi:putative hydrolase of the HAD superfamily